MMKKIKNKKNNGTKEKSKLFSVLNNYVGIIILLIFLALAGSSVNLVIPKIISSAINAFSANKFDAVIVIRNFLFAAVGILIFTFFQGVMQTLTAEKVAKDLRDKLATRISYQSYSYILKSNPDKLLTNLTSDMDSVKMFVSMAFVSIISSFFMIIGASVLLLTINWKLALAVIAIVPIIATVFFVVFNKVKVIFRKVRKVIDSLNRVINESILGAALIRILNSQQAESQKFLEKNIESRNLGLDIVRLFSVLLPIIMFVSNLAIVTILALGGHFVVIGSLSLGDFAAFNSYLAMLIFPVMMIGFMSNIIASATASYERINKVLEEPIPEEKGTINSDLSGDISLQNINLFYGDKPILKDISFTIKPGSKTAIIGPTAAGKTQLLYLISNLITPNSGDIFLDGISIEDYSKEIFYKQLGFVFQDSVMFNMSILENITFNDSVTEEAVNKAIDTAELQEFVDTLPQKLDTIVSERGTSLSGGQKQRIMLARALALNPKILLLDDFTARVDLKTENKILTNIRKNYPELTLLSITQKISPVKDYDQIILLMEGQIVASGKHKDLLEHSPEYVQIYHSQKSTHHYEL